MKRAVLIFIVSMMLVPYGHGEEAPKARPAPSKLSDLYRFMTQQLQRGLVDGIEARHKIVGRSWNIINSGNFYRIDSEIPEFEMQGLRFLKASVEFRNLQVNPAALARWELEVENVQETHTRLVFSLRSLQDKLSAIRKDDSLRVRADIAKQELEISGRGSVAWIGSDYVLRVKPRWDNEMRALLFDTISLSWAGVKAASWLWWLGEGALVEAPVLDMSKSWIQFNVQEVHLGWDRISLSTDW